MTVLDGHLGDYLRLRRSLGFKLDDPGQILPQFLAYLESAGATRVTTELAISWATLPQGVQPIRRAHRLSAARGLARYLNAIDPKNEVPPRDVVRARQQRPTPYLWTEEEVRRLMEATRSIQPELRAISHEALFGLLWASGMRIGEAVALERRDVNLVSGVITVREAKFGRSRLVPLHRTATEALCTYAKRRDTLCDIRKSAAFFVSSASTPLRTDGVRSAFNEITTRIGIRTNARRPRIHDIRHSFAVRVLIEWYRAGADVDAMMPVLAATLGHVNPVSTYWYISACPELMELAAHRLNERLGRS